MDKDSQEPEFLEAVEVSRQTTRQTTRQPQDGPSSSQPSQRDVVDLTGDLDSGSDVEEVFRKSKSVVNSETEDEDEDEELRRAIAMSLKSDVEEVFPKIKSVVSSETKDVDEDEELHRAIAMSLEASDSPNPTTAAPREPPVAPGGILSSLNRKQMEEERLARAAKRKFEGSPSAQESRKLPRPETNPVRPIAPVWKTTRTLQTSSPTASSSQARTPHSPRSEVCRRVDSNAPDSDVRPTSRSVPQWPLGAVKKTHVTGSPRTGNDITIEEVIQRDDLELGVFSSFMWDLDWLFTKISARSRIMLIMQAKDETTKKEHLRDAAHIKNLRITFPPIEPQVFSMHSKLTLLFHAEYVRIAVPTANLTRTDWGEDRLMENTVFLIDLPRMAAPRAGETAFYEELVYFLQASNLHPNIIKKLENFDFSETKRYAFVHSIGGSNIGDKWRRTGFSGLGRAIQTLGLQTNFPINLDYVTSSLGSVNIDLMLSIYLACQGNDAELGYELRTARKKTTPLGQSAAAYSKECLDHFRIYFPSEQTVRAAHANPNMTAGTICFNPGFWTKPGFPQASLRDCVSERGVLMHNKLLYAHPSTPIEMPDNKECRGWSYVGSANMSESAWGRLVKDTSTKGLKMNCRNWECGVIVPIITEKTDVSAQQEGKGKKSEGATSTPLPVEVYKDVVPIPMKLPAMPLSQERKPFFFGA
ncbi:uncharacterized protein N7515_004153 [Penicillium bovifimosum]|uniref:PLD phosphodiesterase domain-containing protein n=1 Tax=Penicillium bovifimosum TaxID=126998 RepID=A0A9W9L6X1_9EURO|nr:uncharacterized protein N7515_004153 [Penicillium bovifimosum]KAJ5139305.1 hypothetical protein N7515_004153 [Penicillium bovifimosum]